MSRSAARPRAGQDRASFYSEITDKIIEVAPFLRTAWRPCQAKSRVDRHAASLPVSWPWVRATLTLIRLLASVNRQDHRYTVTGKQGKLTGGTMDLTSRPRRGPR